MSLSIFFVSESNIIVVTETGAHCLDQTRWQLLMKFEAELNILNTSIYHYRFLCRGTSLILKVVQGGTVH